MILCGNRVALNPVLGGMRDVATAIIPHEQTQSNRDAVFSKDLFSDYFQMMSIASERSM